MNRKFFIITIATAIFAADVAPVEAQSVFRAAAKKLTRDQARQAGRVVNGKVMTMAEWRSLQRSLYELDAEMLARAQRTYGKYISRERWRAARTCNVCYLNRREMDAYLQRYHPDLGTAERRELLGLYERQREKILVQMGTSKGVLPSTVAHERLHQLAHKNYSKQVGKEFDEGMTEYFTQRLSRDIPLNDGKAIYPQAREAIERLGARVGDERLAQAYFAGDVRQLAKAVDEQLGPGTFGRVLYNAERRNWAQVNHILRGARN